VTEQQIELGAVLDKMDELGRTKWNLAVALVENDKLREELARVSNGQNSANPAAGEPNG
jgi:hypothetical protein